MHKPMLAGAHFALFIYHRFRSGARHVGVDQTRVRRGRTTVFLFPL